MGLLSRSGPSGAVDAPGGRRLSGLFGGDGCYRSKVLRRLTALAHAPDVCETENTTRDTTHGGARWPASATVCRKRPFATHADRLRPRRTAGMLASWRRGRVGRTIESTKERKRDTRRKILAGACQLGGRER